MAEEDDLFSREDEVRQAEELVRRPGLIRMFMNWAKIGNTRPITDKDIRYRDELALLDARAANSPVFKDAAGIAVKNTEGEAKNAERQRALPIIVHSGELDMREKLERRRSVAKVASVPDNRALEEHYAELMKSELAAEVADHQRTLDIATPVLGVETHRAFESASSTLGRFQRRLLLATGNLLLEPWAIPAYAAGGAVLVGTAGAPLVVAGTLVGALGLKQVLSGASNARKEDNRNGPHGGGGRGRTSVAS